MRPISKATSCPRRGGYDNVDGSIVKIRALAASLLLSQVLFPEPHGPTVFELSLLIGLVVIWHIVDCKHRKAVTTLLFKILLVNGLSGHAAGCGKPERRLGFCPFRQMTGLALRPRRERP